MKEEQLYIDEFEKLNITKVKTNADGVLIIDIPNDRVNDFLNLYSKVMKPGRWNEYVGPKTGFYFKSSSGEFKDILLTPISSSEINEELRNYIPTWNADQDLWQWIDSIDIYEGWLR